MIVRRLPFDGEIPAVEMKAALPLRLVGEDGCAQDCAAPVFAPSVSPQPPAPRVKMAGVGKKLLTLAFWNSLVDKMRVIERQRKSGALAEQGIGIRRIRNDRAEMRFDRNCDSGF